MSTSKEKNSLFRDKSMEQFTAPEQLNDYIRVINPSLIIILIAIISLLAGIILWGYLGRIDAHEDVTGYVSNGTLQVYLSAANGADLSKDSSIVVGGKEYAINTISSAGKAGLFMEEDDLERFQLNSDDLVIALTTNCDLPDGIYYAKVVMATIRPISLILG